MSVFSLFSVLLLVGGSVAVCAAGPYSGVMDDASNVHDAPVPGFTGPHGSGRARLMTGMLDEAGDREYENESNYVNPLFFCWAGEVTNYHRADGQVSFSDPMMALGPVTGDNFDVVSLGDLDEAALAAGGMPGEVTMVLEKPVENLTGVDFVVFENGFVSGGDYGGAGTGGLFGELAYIEVSGDGSDFVRFPSRSLTTSPVGGYGSIDASDVWNLAGKHANAYGDCWGTPFDLDDVGLDRITHVRVVDIPGDGSSLDREGDPVYDGWPTWGSGGFDLEAVGGVSVPMVFGDWPQLELLAPDERGAGDDPDGDGLCNLLEYSFARLPWKADASGARPVLRREDGALVLGFLRDERARDLRYVVQFSESLEEADWVPVALSSGGMPVTCYEAGAAEVSEASASDIRGVGVVREVEVSLPVAKARRGFLRVLVEAEVF